MGLSVDRIYRGGGVCLPRLLCVVRHSSGGPMKGVLGTLGLIFVVFFAVWSLGSAIIWIMEKV